MFPDAKHMPAQSTQLTDRAFVSAYVSCNFFLPVLPVVFRGLTMQRAAVPEAAINKKSNHASGKRKIRFSRQWVAPSPSGKTLPA